MVFGYGIKFVKNVRHSETALLDKQEIYCKRITDCFQLCNLSRAKSPSSSAGSLNNCDLSLFFPEHILDEVNSAELPSRNQVL